MTNLVLLSFAVLASLAMFMIFVPNVRKSKFTLACIGAALLLIGAFILYLISDIH